MGKQIFLTPSLMMSDDNILRISPEGDIFQSSLDQGPRLCCCLGRAGFHHYSNSAIKKSNFFFLFNAVSCNLEGKISPMVGCDVYDDRHPGARCVVAH